MSSEELGRLASCFHQDYGLMEVTPLDMAESHVRQLGKQRKQVLRQELKQLLRRYPGADNRGLRRAWVRAGAEWWDPAIDLRGFLTKVLESIDQPGSHHEYVATKRLELVATAHRILDGDLGVIEGCRAVSGLRTEVGADPLDDDFLTFVAVESETDTLPIGSERSFWSSTALQVQDREIAKADAAYGDIVRRACGRLIERFET